MAPKRKAGSPPKLPWNKEKMLRERSSHSVIGQALERALDLMILGYPEEATRIVRCLYENDAFEFRNETAIQNGFLFGWDATDSTPDFVRDPDLNKPRAVRKFRDDAEDESYEDRLDRLEKKVREEWPKELGKKWPKVTKAQLKMAEDEMKEPESHSQESDSKAALAAVEIALELGDDERAEEIILDHFVGKYWEFFDNPDKIYQRSESRQKIAESRQTWRLLSQGIMGKELGIQDDDIKVLVETIVETVEHRFTQGPTHAFAEHSIAELVKIIDENYVAARHSDPNCGTTLNCVGRDIPDTFTKDGATDKEIRVMQWRLGTKEEPYELPEDYITFLKASNGIYVDDPQDQSSIFYGAESVDRGDTMDDCGVGIELIPYEYLNYDMIDAIDWPPTEATYCSLGAAGDEGSSWLLQPKEVKRGLEAFEEFYSKATESQKCVLRRGAMDLYGGLEEMRKLEWVIITWHHWNPESEPYGGFRAYLEHEAQSAVNEKEKADADAAKEAEDANKRQKT